MFGLGKAVALVLIMVVAPATALAASGSRRAVTSATGATGSPVAGTWRRLSAAPIEVDTGLTSVWTGTKMIVIGAQAAPDGTLVNAVDRAAAYDPATRTWRELKRPPKTGSYCRRDAVWTGREMLIWGCDQVAFDPKSNRWRRLPRAGGQGIVVWTGREMIGWGGGCCGDAWSGGAAYDPATDTWRKLARSPLAPEQRPIGAWTGRELVLFVSGMDAVDGKPFPARIARAAAYDPATDTWRRVAPLPEPGGTAVWNGRELLVVGGGAKARAAFALDPITNHWRRLASLPSPRVGPTAVWSGKRLFVWSGQNLTASRYLRDGLAYDPKADRWSPLPRAPIPALLPNGVGGGSAVVWTGRSLIVWGAPAGSGKGDYGAEFKLATP